MPIATPADGQLNFDLLAAETWADRLRSFYDSLPAEPAPERHWDLLLQIALEAPENTFSDFAPALSRAPRMIWPPGGCSLTG